MKKIKFQDLYEIFNDKCGGKELSVKKHQNHLPHEVSHKGSENFTIFIEIIFIIFLMVIIFTSNECFEIKNNGTS